MQIAGYLKTSLIEWPGKISSVIFTLGCNFRCPFCHNADLVDSLKFNKKMLLSEGEVLMDLKKRQNWVDAVVITGGEPTLQKDLSKFLEKIKKMGFLTMIHTNGTDPRLIVQLLNCSIVDYICMDVKGNLENYSNYTDYSNDQVVKRIKESMRLIINSGVEYELRTTVVPGLHNNKNLLILAKQLKEIFENCPPALYQNGTGPAGGLKIENCRWFLQQFRPMNTFAKKFMEIKPFSREELETFQKELQKIIPQTFLRGV